LALPDEACSLKHTFLIRETTNAAKVLVKLQEEKFDMLLPENMPTAKAPAGVLGAGLKGLEELKAVINGHLKVRNGWGG
jgi:hypothetical protein